MILLIATLSCVERDNEGNYDMYPPEDSRFIRKVFISNLFEPTELVVLPNGKIFFTQRRGAIKQYDPGDGSFITYDSIPVHFEHEDGLMGLALDPEFEYNNWVYLYYSPVGSRSVNRLSRFSYTSKGFTKESVMLEVPVQREECCHTGGSVEFGPDGLLYLSTGDNTNPFASDGYSPTDERPGRSPWDAQRTSSNTNDLRGKILRIKPERDGSYSIPPGNLFEDEDSLTRPEIYVMGCRNPYRIAVDDHRGWLFWGDVGPDASENREGRGPRGHDEFNVATGPGYFGWPLFVGNNQAYNDYDFATGKSSPVFKPDAPLNNSINNTGRNQLPPAQPAKIYYPYANYDVFPLVGNGGRNAMAGPVYYSDQYEGRTKFPSSLDGRVIFYDWMRGFIFFLELDNNGNPIDWYQILPNESFNNIIDMEFGPDGQLYLIEYGTGWFLQNENAQLSTVKFVRGNRPPLLKASLSTKRGAAPLEVTFDATKSMDYDGDNLRYEWTVEQNKITDSVFSYTFNEVGVYYPELSVYDSKGNISTEQFVVEVGNEPPTVAIKIKGNKTFFWKGRSVDYSVEVSDLEDEQSPQGINEGAILFDIAHYQSTDLAESLGHQQPVNQGKNLLQSLDCKACHHVNQKSIGPSYQSVAERYIGDRNAVNYLSYKIINGGGGVWGEQVMSAHPDLSTEKAKSIVQYILSLAHTSKFPLKGSFTPTKKSGRYLLSATYKDRGKAPLRPIAVTKNLWLREPVIQAGDFDESMDVHSYHRTLQDVFSGSWAGYHAIDLTNIHQLKLSLDQKVVGTMVTVRQGSANGRLLGTGHISSPSMNDLVIDLKPTMGLHDIYLVFHNDTENENIIQVSTLEFVPKSQ